MTVEWAPGAAAVDPRVARLFGITTRLPSERGVLLTFDDGPHPQGTPAVLAALDRADARAVFFVTGEQASLHSRFVSEIVAAGHELGMHGYRHQTRRQWSSRLLLEDTRRAIDAIARAGTAPPRLYRPPHGVFSRTGLRLIRGLGLAPLLWSKWGRDWEPRATASTIARLVTDGIRPGDVILLHDGDHYAAAGSWRRTAGALPVIFDCLDSLGLKPASLRRDSCGETLALTC